MTPEKPAGQRSLRQAAREGARRDGPQPLPAPKSPPPALTAAKRQEKPKPPVVGTEPCTRSYGHTEAFEKFADNQDRFREERRKKFQSKPCTACRDQKQAEMLAQQAKAKAERHAKPRPRFHPEETKGRLPDGATYTACYSTEDKEWYGVLSLRGSLETPGIRFTATRSGLFPLLTCLDTMYREWLAKNASSPPAGAP